MLPDGTLSHERSDYIPPSVAWEMSDVLNELLRISLELLKPGGRLVHPISQSKAQSDIFERSTGFLRSQQSIKQTTCRNYLASD